jgi:alanine racemase
MVQVMIDTGMNREGVPADQVSRLLAEIDSQPGLRLAGVCTHFVCSELADQSLAHEQLEHFSLATRDISPAVMRHAANSGAIFNCPQSHLNMVRPGISLYGIDPAGKPTPDRGLRPAMKWVAPLLLVRDVKQGQSVGYGQTWVAGKDSRIGLVPVGYADGYLRCWSNSAMMLLHGRPAAVVGRVSMDCTMIDLSQIPQARVGDEVVVLDDQPTSPAGVYALARAAGTIPYEVFCRIGPRVRRVAIDPADKERNAWDTPGSTLVEKFA